MHDPIALVIFLYLHCVILSNHPERISNCLLLCTWWIGDGGMMSIVKEQRTPVWSAAFRGHIDVVKFLVLEANADPNQPTKV